MTLKKSNNPELYSVVKTLDLFLQKSSTFKLKYHQIMDLKEVYLIPKAESLKVTTQVNKTPYKLKKTKHLKFKFS